MLSDMKRVLVYSFFITIFCLPVCAHAQADNLEQGVWRAEVINVSNEQEVLVPGTDTPTKVQTLQVKILEGPRTDEVIVMENDFLMMKDGQIFFMNYLIGPDGTELFSVRDIDRRAPLMWLGLLFVGVVLAFGRKQGLRSLVSLAGSFLVIIYVLLPLLLQGFNPVLMSIVIGALILFVAIFFTHGFSFRSLTAFGGTVISIGLTGILATVAIDILQLSGFFSDETVYLNFTTNGLLDFKGLLLGGMIIGVLGVLDDIAITQVAVVAELKHAAPGLTRRELYTKALRVGREHVSALVNTIVLAYAGVSLPLLLWFYDSTLPFSMILNNEVFATEIARTIVGSIGLILTVPITTLLAAMFVERFVHDHGDGHSHGHTHNHTH
jgi:uncharacterized membrane protein